MEPKDRGEAQENLIKSYYIAVANCSVTFGSINREPELISSFALFSGQGSSQYFPCLLELHKLYGVFIYEQLLLPISTILNGLIQSDSSIACAYPQGLAILNWLENPEQAPDEDYLLSAPVSFPLLALAQLAQYCVDCKRCDATPGEYIKDYLGATGRSQSIVTALAFALSGSWDSFFNNAVNLVSMMVFIGSCTQLSYSRIMLECKDNYESGVTPMLMIRNLSLDQVQSCLDEANKELPIEKSAAISIVNSSTNVVVSGPAEPLDRIDRIVKERIVSAEIRAPENSEGFVQSESSCIFLPIYVPLHSKCLNDSYEQIMQDITNAGIEFSSKDIRIPVFDTNNGTNLQEYDNTTHEYTLTSRLVKLNIELPADWDSFESKLKGLDSAACKQFGDLEIYDDENK